MRPLHDRCLIKHLDSERDALWLPDSAGYLQRGVLVEVGECAEHVTKGDVVLYRADEAMRIRVPLEGGGEEELFLVGEPGIYVVLEDARVNVDEPA